MKDIKLVIKKKDKVDTIERTIYEIEDSVAVNEIFSGLIDTTKLESNELYKIQTNIAGKVKSIPANVADKLFNDFCNIKTKEDVSNLLVDIKEVNRKIAIKGVVESNVRIINALLKDKGLETITSESEVDLEEIDKLCAAKGLSKYLPQVEEKLSNDKLNNFIESNPDYTLSIFMNKLFNLYYSKIVQRYSLQQLEDMNREIFLGNTSCLDEICIKNDNELINEYSKKVISDLIFTNYSSRLNHICWNNHCDNAEVTKCTKIATNSLDITKPMFKYITFGVMIVEGKSIDRCIVLRCKNFERCNYVPKKVTEKVPKKVETNDDLDRFKTYNSSSGRTFMPSTPITELTAEEKKGMLTVREREALRRNDELKLLKAKKELIEATNTVKPKKKTKKK